VVLDRVVGQVHPLDGGQARGPCATGGLLGGSGRGVGAGGGGGRAGGGGAPARGRGDLLAWAEQYAEEMSSELGREMIRDVLAAEGALGPRRCCAYARQQIAVIAERAGARGEAFPSIDTILDRVIAPILFRILFDEALATERVGGLVENAFSASA
jgi:hypothetical protein